MTRRSLRSSAKGIIEAKQALAAKGWTQEYLAGEVGLSSRQSIWKFLTGRPVDRHIFQEICFKLDLNWENIADLPDELSTAQSSKLVEQDLGIEELAQAMRSQIRESIYRQCNTLQSSFELTQPPLQKIYTIVNFLPQPNYQRWLEVSDLQSSLSTRQPSSLSSSNSEAITDLDVVTKHDKLMILGKPGAGKTTFLQYLGLQCNQGNYRRDLIPCFIQLRREWEQGENELLNLVTYLVTYCRTYGLSEEQALRLLQGGHFLCLLDGLDEVPQQIQETLCKNIDSFAQEFYKNQVIIASRSSAQQFHFRGFTYVEISDFDRQQIQCFSQKWFAATIPNKAKAKSKAKQFLEQLDNPENRPIRELAVTPILLNLLCSVFKEKASFPRQRTRLYQTGLDILLQRWDQARGIERDSIYHDLPLLHKIKLLSQIAAVTFSENRYFFESREILTIIETYLVDNLGYQEDAETLWLTSESILKSIELQHGILVERAKDIYSFSHLTFQEYFAARNLVSQDSKTLENDLTKLANNILDYRWREVILLTASMLPKADFLIQEMKQVIDNLSQEDADLIRFLNHLDRKVKSLEIESPEVAVRAFYFTLFRHRDLNLALALDPRLADQANLSPTIQLDVVLAKAFMDSLQLVGYPSLKKFLNLCFTLELEKKFQLNSDFLKAIKQLKSQLPTIEKGKCDILKWWKTQGKKWIKTFQDILVKYRHISYDWQLNEFQKQLWDSYYQANLFLVECLQGDCQVSPTLQQKVETTLLLAPQKSRS